jgi:hypothetical protein
MTSEDIERIVLLLKETTDTDVQRILKTYLTWKLSPPFIDSEAIKFMER